MARSWQKQDAAKPLHWPAGSQPTNRNFVAALQATGVLCKPLECLETGALPTRVLLPSAIFSIDSSSYTWGNLTLFIWSCCTIRWCTGPLAFCCLDVWSLCSLSSPRQGTLWTVLFQQQFSQILSEWILVVAELLQLTWQQALGSLSGAMKWIHLCFSNYKMAIQKWLQHRCATCVFIRLTNIHVINPSSTDACKPITGYYRSPTSC